MISFRAFSDETVKIAQELQPSSSELEKPEERYMNKEVLKRFLLDAGVTSLGVGAGYGLGRLTVDALKKTNPPPWLKATLLATVPMVGAGTALLLNAKLKEERDRRISEAYQLGQQTKGQQ